MALSADSYPAENMENSFCYFVARWAHSSSFALTFARALVHIVRMLRPIPEVVLRHHSLG